MADTKKSWDLLSEEKQKKMIDEIIGFFQDERGEEIGVIAAEEILDFFLQTIGIELFNKGVEDSIKFMRERIEGMELDMETMLKKESINLRKTR